MIFEMASCSGCKTCEMACSIKNTGEFSPAKSAIRILDKEDGPGFLISLEEQDEGMRRACVGCQECVQYCPAGEDLKQIIAEFMEQREKRKHDSKVDSF